MSASSATGADRQSQSRGRTGAFGPHLAGLHPLERLVIVAGALLASGVAFAACWASEVADEAPLGALPALAGMSGGHSTGYPFSVNRVLLLLARSEI